MPPNRPTCLSTPTDGSGDYHFSNITSGNYYYAVPDPASTHISTLGGNHDPSINDQVDDGVPSTSTGYVISQVFVHVSTTSSTFFDFGYSEYAEVGGLVWDDTDGDGIQNGTITGHPNVTVELINSSGVSQGSTLTAANGSYLFSPVFALDYYLTFTPPTGYIFSPDNIGSDDSLDSDPDRLSGDTTTFSLSQGNTDLTWDAGVYPESAHIFDPPSGYKSVDTDGWPSLVWRQVWINDSNVSSNLVRIEDPIPAHTEYVDFSLSCSAEGSSITTTCIYDSINNQIVWEGIIGADPGATSESGASNEVIIIFRTNIDRAFYQTENQSRAYWDENGDDVLTTLDGNVLADTPQLSDDPNTSYPNDPTIAYIPPEHLPTTGFTPGLITTLPDQELDDQYSDSALVLTIPSQGISMHIVGVPYKNGSWNTDWLSNQAGYLEGSAYPTHTGNTVITGHVWDAHNQPGPFANIGKLQYGDVIHISAYGRVYTYQVQSSTLINSDNISKVFKPEDYDWISLVTCENWDEKTFGYTHYRLVRAILIEISPNQ